VTDFIYLTCLKFVQAAFQFLVCISMLLLSLSYNIEYEKIRCKKCGQVKTIYDDGTPYPLDGHLCLCEQINPNSWQI